MSFKTICLWLLAWLSVSILTCACYAVVQIWRKWRRTMWRRRIPRVRVAPDSRNSVALFWRLNSRG